MQLTRIQPTTVLAPATSQNVPKAPTNDTYDGQSRATTPSQTSWVTLPRIHSNAVRRAAGFACAVAAVYGAAHITQVRAEPVASYAEFTQEGLIITGGQCSWTCTASSVTINLIAAAASALGFLAPGGVIFGPAANVAVRALFRELKMLCVQVGCPTVLD